MRWSSGVGTELVIGVQNRSLQVGCWATCFRTCGWLEFDRIARTRRRRFINGDSRFR